jgi:hypothetical protein
MLSLLEIKQQLEEIIDTFKRNQSELESYQTQLTDVDKRLKSLEKNNPQQHKYISPYEIQKLPAGITSQVNQYISCYVDYMSFAKQFFVSVYLPMQTALNRVSIMMGNIKDTIDARIKTNELTKKEPANILYNQRSATVEDKILAKLGKLKASYDDVNTDFTNLMHWIMTFLSNDLNYYLREKEQKTYFSRIYVRLAPNAEICELAEFSKISREILQKYLNNDISDDKQQLKLITEISEEEMSLLVDEIALKIDCVHFDKENCVPNKPVSGLVLNTHRVLSLR